MSDMHMKDAQDLQEGEPTKEGMQSRPQELVDRLDDIEQNEVQPGAVPGFPDVGPHRGGIEKTGSGEQDPMEQAGGGQFGG